MRITVLGEMCGAPYPCGGTRPCGLHREEAQCALRDLYYWLAFRILVGASDTSALRMSLDKEYRFKRPHL